MWWRLAAGAGALIAFGFLAWLFGNARFNAGELAERNRWKDAAIVAEKRVAAVERGWAERLISGQTRYVDRIVEKVRPVILTNKETVTRYAESPAGRVLCLAPERVLGIEQTRAALFAPPATAPGGSPQTLRADGAPEGR